MKRIQFLFKGRGMFLPLIFLTIFAFSCSSDDDKVDTSQVDFENEYFTVVHGEFSSADLPRSNASDLDIISLFGNSTVLAGGSNPITVVTPENASRIIVGVQGRKGHFIIPVGSQVRNANGRTTLSSGISSSLSLLIGNGVTDDFIISFAAQNSNGDVGDYYQLEVNYLEAGTGKLHVSLSWNRENDVDLHLIEPNGETIYYGNRFSSNGGQLDIDSNAACDIDGVKNENIYYEDEPDVIVEAGEYEVLVDLWSSCNITEPTEFIVTVYYGDGHIAPTQGQNPYSGVLLPDDDNSEMRSIMKFNISGNTTSAIDDQQQRGEGLPVFQFKFKDQDKVERSKVLSPQKM